MTEPVVVGLLGITHPHASARVRALREIAGVQVVAAADDDPRLKYFTDKYDLAPVTTDEILTDERITAVLVHSKSKDMVPLALRVLTPARPCSSRSPAAPRWPTSDSWPRPRRHRGRSRRSGTTCASPTP
jgi:hypothetical protein